MILQIITFSRCQVQGSDQREHALSLRLDDLEIRRVFWVQTNNTVSRTNIEVLQKYLCDPILESASTEKQADPRNQVWIAYKRGIVDNECDSLVRLCGILGIDAIAAKVGKVFFSNDNNLFIAVKQRYFNPNIEEIHTSEPHYDTLLPLGHYTPVETVDLRGLSDGRLVALGRRFGRNLDLKKMKRIQQIQIDTAVDSVTDVFIEAMDARWSDHCYHTTWKSLGGLLQKLMKASEATANPNIVSMFTDNAGIWDFYENQALVIKGETHNGPSAISAYFGQLTKLGGVLRDILGAGLGADPIGSFEYTATGIPGTQSPLEGLPASLQIAAETVRAIREYGNTFGVPMMSSRMCFHPSYRAKPFALGGSIGLIPKALAQKGKPQAGDLVLLIGGLTGNDGIHGASASSAGADMDETAVQIGSPLEEVKFNTAITDLRDAGCLRAITDVGGAGLNSAVGEIGDPCGVWLNTALVPLKTAGLPMWRILLSESQERMILAIKPEMLDEARRLLRRHEVRNTVIGRFTGSGRYTVVYAPEMDEAKIVSASNSIPPVGEIGIDVPYSLLSFVPDDLPIPKPVKRLTKHTVWPQLSAKDLAEVMPKLIADSEINNQAYVDSQYDSTVQGRRTYGPYAGSNQPVRTKFWASELIPGKSFAAVFATAFNPWLYEANPTLALRHCFFEVLTKMVGAGVRLNDIGFCDNFYTPHLSEDWSHWLVAMVDELSLLIKSFGTPVISGKDSSAGSVITPEGPVHVPPAVFLSAIGKTQSFDDLLRNEWQGHGSVIVKVGLSCKSAAGTAAARVLGIDANDVDDINIEAFCRYLNVLERADRSGWLSAVSIGSGGILTALAECALSSGFKIEIVESSSKNAPWLLAEHRGALLLEVNEMHMPLLPPELEPCVVGHVREGPPSIRLDNIELLTTTSIDRWSSSFTEHFK